MKLYKYLKIFKKKKYLIIKNKTNKTLSLKLIMVWMNLEFFKINYIKKFH